MLDRVSSRLSGSYKVKAKSSELARDRKARTIPCTVLFLNDTQHTFQLEKRAKGVDLLEQVYKHLDLNERDYFGLQFTPPKDVVRWLDPNKSFRKQWITARDDDVNNVKPTLEFRIKFFVTDPARLQEEYTRYQFYLQVKRDIFCGRLPVTLNTGCLLASYTVQAELGDFNPLDHMPGYLKSMQLLPHQDDNLEQRISELHKLHRGQLPADAEYNYLDHAKRLEFYGVDFHKATDSNGKDINLGVCSIGLLVYQNNVRINTFSWSKMVKVSFKRKEFFIQLRRESSESYDTLLGFSMGSHKNAKALWKACVEHHSFFRLQKPQRISRFPQLSIGSKFSYNGRTELQAVEESKQRTRLSKAFVRSPSKRGLAGVPTMNGGSNGESTNGKQSLLNKTDKVTSKQSVPRKAWESYSDDEGGFPISEAPPAYSGENLTNAQIDDSMVTVRLKVDEQGRFGFNVKGGLELELPIMVARVVPNTPADLASPRICEGDQVIMINGRDTNGMTSSDAMDLIRTAREACGEIVLVLRPHPIGMDVEDEPSFLYVPDTDLSSRLHKVNLNDKRPRRQAVV